MSLKVEGQTCPVCHAYLFDEDDVVYCSICGAPHHRDCYKSIGHCGYESLHGTEQQYDRQKHNNTNFEEENADKVKDTTIVCPHCMKKLEEDTPICPYCGKPRNGIFNYPGSLIGVSDISDIDGVKAQTVAEFVAVNTQSYIPKFSNISKQRKISWNWAAFLFPEGWFFYRKMYKVGALIFSVILAAEVCLIPMRLALSAVSIDETSYQIQQYAEAFSKSGTASVILAIIAAIVMLGTRIITAMFGDYIYKCNIIPNAIKAEKILEDKPELIKKYGGINLLLFIGGLMAVRYIPTIIAAFII